MSIIPGTAATVTSAGNSATLQGGPGGTTSGAGGAVNITGGTPSSGNGGAVNITAANGVGTNKNGGNVSITAGSPTGSGSAGVISMMGGSVGVGTANPSAKLEVNGDLKVSGFSNIGVDPGSFIYFGDTATNIQGNGSLQFKANGIIAQTINSSGNVGIGTTTPSYLLSLKGTGADQTIGMERETTAATAGRELSIQAGGATLNSTDKAGGSLNLISGISTGNGGSDIGFYVAAGGQGTGTTSRNPINKMAYLSGTHRSVELIGGPATGLYSAAIGYGMQVDGDNSVGISLNTSLYTLSQNNAMAIMGGDVGIGTTTPGDKLHVAGNIRGTGQISTGSQTIIGGTTAIDWNNGNAISTDYDCSSNFTFANLRDGGTYTLLVTNAGTTQCGFSTTTTGQDAATVTYKFNPANATRTASTYTVYTLMRIGTTVLVSWSSGFQ